MTRQHGSIFLIALSAVLGLCFASGTAFAADIAWDIVNSTNQNLVSYGTDAPVFGSPASGFQIFAVGASPSIPYALVDDSVVVYPADVSGIIDSSVDFHEFFGICDTINADNPTSSPYNATWVFDISSATGNVALSIDLAAMGNFELTDTYEWSYQIDAGPTTAILGAVADENGSQTYTLADGDVFVVDDPLVVSGNTLSNIFQTFTTPIATGSQLTVVLTASTDSISEGYAARNILITGDTAAPPPPATGGLPIPTLSQNGSLAVVLLLMFVGVFLIRRLR